MLSRLVLLASLLAGCPLPPMTDDDGDGVLTPLDCDDTDATIFPGAFDLPGDGIDQDCDGADAGRVDADGDGVPFGMDCDDNDPSVWQELPYYPDADQDGRGDNAGVVLSCGRPPGFATVGGDCNDRDPAYHPYAIETCSDQVDLNCDGSIGDVDLDLDGESACGGDCDDGDASVNTAADEFCHDLIDNNCDGSVDDGFAVDAELFCPDMDGDGFGPLNLCVPACEDPGIFLGAVVHTPGDCNDADPQIHPGAADPPGDGIDRDCDGSD